MDRRKWNWSQRLGLVFLFVFAIVGLYPTAHSYFQPIPMMNDSVMPNTSQWELVSVKKMGIWSLSPVNDCAGYVQPEDIYWAKERGYKPYYMVRNDALIARNKNSAFTINIVSYHDGYRVYLPDDFQPRELNGIYALTPVNVVFLGKDSDSQQTTDDYHPTDHYRYNAISR